MMCMVTCHSICSHLMDEALKTLAKCQWDGHMALVPQIKISGDDRLNQDHVYFSSEQRVCPQVTFSGPSYGRDHHPDWIQGWASIGEVLPNMYNRMKP